MKCLICTSESVPFAGTGGLSEVCTSLAIELCKEDVDCRVVMPLYSDIEKKYRDKMEFVGNFNVPLAWRSVYCGIFKMVYRGVTFYFVDNEYYFKRQGLYGHYDDAERFAFFSRAVLEMIPNVDFKPDIIHCNDWQTALVSVFYSAIYAKYEWYYNIKTVFTIHNIQYQGKYGKELFTDILGLDPSEFSVLEFENCINFMKGAIETANRVTTVSRTYSYEILDPWFSYGLSPILNARKFKIVGIRNGIDTSSYNPKTDENIYVNYDENLIELKLENKVKLQNRLNLEIRKEVPMIGMVTRMVSHKGLDIVREAFDEIMKEDIQIVILGSGDREYEDFFNYMQDKYKGRVSSCHGFVPELSRKIYAASDMFLMPSQSEPCGLAQMIALRYGSIPIVRETGGLVDTISDSGDNKGNGFTFKNYDPWDMLGAIKRGIAGYYKKDGWEILMKRAMSCDNSWSASAKRYIGLYNSLIK